MKQIIILLTTVVLFFSLISNSNGRFSQPQTPPKCPSQTTETVYYNDYTDCTLYYECINGKAESKRCPNHFFWDHNDKVS